ncbi:unconventional myosin-XV-like [Heterodontus francisci]|uniref:unconventional myosin-XV-like n=1 Tax=Heterodontus francisci TaxID=7792 RepID=UPI00355C25B8
MLQHIHFSSLFRQDYQFIQTICNHCVSQDSASQLQGSFLTKYTGDILDASDLHRLAHYKQLLCTAWDDIPGQFDVECVGAQLRHSGIMEAIHIRKEGYPVRILLPDFTSRYSILLGWKKENSSDSELCSSILEKITEKTPGFYQLGLTKVFLKKKLFNQLEYCWQKTQNWAALTIQKNIRGFINRKNFRHFKHKIVIIQSNIRGHQARTRYKKLKRTLMRFGTAVVISRAIAHRRRNQEKSTEQLKIPGW